MIRHILIVSLFFSATFASAQDLKVFTDARSAIAAAKQADKHIVFFLWDSKDKSHLEIAKALNSDLQNLTSEYVLVNLAHSARKNRDLFSGRFSKALTLMPIAVVSNALGEAIKSYQGTKPVGYEKMLISARIEGGQVTDPVALANLKESLARVGENRGFLAPMVKDLNVKKVAITKMRQWTKKDGTVFKAILLEALGAEGVFVDEKGVSTKVQFTELSPENLEYLQTILEVKKSE